MRIGIVSLHTSPTEKMGTNDSGGMNVVVGKTAQFLHELGHDVTVFTRASAATPEGTHHLSPHGPKVIAFAAGDPLLLKNELPSTLDSFANQLSRQEPFDVLHSHYWLSAAASSIALSKNSDLAKQHFVSFHTIAALKNSIKREKIASEPTQREQLERKIARKNHIIAVSGAELTEIEKHYGRPPRATVIYPGVDTEIFTPGKRKDNTILVVGRVQPFKGQDFAIDVFKSIRTREKYKLLLVGESTPDSHLFFEGLKAENRDEPRIKFVGAKTHEELAGLLSKAKVVLIPSLSETFGLVALEAAASGAVGVAQNISGLKESIKDGVTGLLINDRDAAQWGLQIGALLEDEKALQAIATNARSWALQNDWKEQTLKLEKVFKEAVLYFLASR